MIGPVHTTIHLVLDEAQLRAIVREELLAASAAANQATVETLQRLCDIFEATTKGQPIWVWEGLDES